MATTLAVPQRSEKISEGISTALLLTLALISLTGSVAAVGWVEGLSMLVWPALAGMLLGMLIAKLPVRGRVAYPFAMSMALVASVVLPALSLVDPTGNREKILFMVTRLRDWTFKVLRGGTASDNLVFVVQLVFFAFLFAFLAAWLIYRKHQVWGAISLIGGALLLNLFYAPPQGHIYLILFLLSALLLVVRLNLHALEHRWRTASIGYSSDISFDFFQYGIGFALALLLLAWALPESPPGAGSITVFEPFQSLWENIEDEFARSFSGVKPVERRGGTPVTSGTLVIGGPIKLTDRPTFEVQAESGRYWRSVVYDRYTGGGWISTHTDVLTLNSGDPRINIKTDSLRTTITQTIRVRAPDAVGFLYAASQPVRYDIPVDVRYSKSISDKGDFGFDLAFARARRTLRDGDTYTVLSSLSRADEESLREVGNTYTYPAWFVNDYLQVPDRVPQRLQNLAKTITQNSKNAYDKASAIEKYVRTKIKYNESVPVPPTGRDAVDYMLFERPEGYCNYYASAMALLARLNGIPARVASGYSLTESRNGVYYVQEKDSHAWVEIYFPNYGWVEFEPTANKPEIVRPKKDEPTQSNNDDSAQSERERRRELNAEFDDPLDIPLGGSGSFQFNFGSDPLNLSFLILGLFVVLSLATLGLAQWNRRRRVAHLTPAARVYEEMLYYGRALGVREDATHTATPLENADALAERVPAARADTERIAAYYTRERFGAWKPRMTDRAAMEMAWGRVRTAWWSALVARVVTYVRSLPSAVLSRLKNFVKRGKK